MHICMYIWHINAYINTFTTIRATRLTASTVSIISHFIVVVIATRLTIIIRTLISSASDRQRGAKGGVTQLWPIGRCLDARPATSCLPFAALQLSMQRTTPES